MAFLRVLLVTLIGLVPVAAHAGTVLLMAEEVGCYWCEKWDAEISDIYPKTAEGRTAPLQRFDIHRDPPASVQLTGPVHFTPTFILVRDNVEIGRIEGYPGEDFFWGLLDAMFRRARIDTEATG